MSRGIRARVNRDALRHNFQVAQRAAPHSKIMAVVKADAYGHGATEVAKTLSEANALAVAGLEEGVRLREAGENRDILLLTGIHQIDELEEATEHGLSVVVHSQWQIDALSSRVPARPIKAWLKLDTGMNRVGFSWGQGAEIIEKVAVLPCLKLVGVMSHLASADQLENLKTTRQAERFDIATKTWDGDRGLANSAAILGWPRLQYDWVRPGLMLYGCSPFTNESERALALQPAMTLEARIIAMQEVATGESVGYNEKWRSERPTRVATVACGYGDGYPWIDSPVGEVLVRGQRCRILGRVSMDMLCVDLSSCPQARIGDWVELWGETITASEVARSMKTSVYAVITGLASRVPKFYV